MLLDRISELEKQVLEANKILCWLKTKRGHIDVQSTLTTTGHFTRRDRGTGSDVRMVVTADTLYDAIGEVIAKEQTHGD